VGKIVSYGERRHDGLLVQPHLVNRLLLKLPLVGALVEVEIPSENLVSPLPTENHLDSHGLDFARHQVHGCAGPDSGHIVRFNVADDFADGVESLLQ